MIFNSNRTIANSLHGGTNFRRKGEKQYRMRVSPRGLGHSQLRAAMSAALHRLADLRVRQGFLKPNDV